MGAIQVAPRSVGRPSSKQMTIRILPNGTIRLSPDLCVFETYSILVDVKKLQIVFRFNGPYKLWYSRPEAKSGLLSAIGVFHTLGIKPKDISGEYAVKSFKYGFTVDLEKP